VGDAGRLPADLARVVDRVGPLDDAAMAAAFERHLSLAKPPGSLGKLEGLGLWLAGVQGRAVPERLTPRRVVVLAGDHGVAAAGVTAQPAAATAARVATFAAGGAAVNALARAVDAEVVVADLAVDDEPDRRAPGVLDLRIRRGSGRIDTEPALTTDETLAALRTGVALADAAADAGVRLLVPGDMGVGSTTIAAALVCATTGAEPVEAVGHGTGVDDAAWSRAVRVVRDALRRSASSRDDPVSLLAELGGADVAAMTGLLVGAAARRVPVVLDGVLSGAAALVAAQLSPVAPAYWAAGHRCGEPAHARALAHLGLEPLLDLGLRLGEGTGALLAVPLLDAAVAVLREMATAGEPGVAGPA
jgi:nicotinate-nucleotide--dimethylbenzimidazole phosphoribosyltransferase